jgi:hypothetical protein
MHFVKVAIFAAIVACPIAAYAVPLTPEEAANHIGETATVCGAIASTTYAD